MVIKNIKTNWDYSSLAKHYDQRADYSKILLKKLLKIMKCNKYYHVADIGAGTGKLTKLLCENKLIVNAVEPNKNMRFFGEKNTKNYKNINWSYGTGENTYLRKNSIYCIFFGSSFNTVNYKLTFKEIKKVLVDGGYFCCMWNHRDLNDVTQKNIENIIKKFIPKFSYGERRLNYKKTLESAKIFNKIKKISQPFSIKIEKKKFIDGWRSHGTLKRNCKNLSQFNDIIEEISNYINSLKQSYVIVPYVNVSYLAKLK